MFWGVVSLFLYIYLLIFGRAWCLLLHVGSLAVVSRLLIVVASFVKKFGLQGTQA